MNAELIISTYNSPVALNLVLSAITRQTRPPQSVAIADDGSGPETRALLESYADRLPIRHVWHPDTGFAKNEILNRAIASSTATLLIFIDGDCVASPGFIARHIDLAHPQKFTTGSVLRLSERTTEALTEADVLSGKTFDHSWLKAQGEVSTLSRSVKAGRFSLRVSALLDRLSPVRKTWSGGNASTYRSLLMEVNGFDMSMRYGGEDKELGSRLINAGIKGQFLRYSAPLLHLHHARGYVDPEIVKSNRAWIGQTRKTGKTRTEHGIADLPHRDNRRISPHKADP